MYNRSSNPLILASMAFRVTSICLLLIVTVPGQFHKSIIVSLEVHRTSPLSRSSPENRITNSTNRFPKSSYEGSGVNNMQAFEESDG